MSAYCTHHNSICQVSFSSYPGMLSSTDDYYLTGNKLMVTETTLSIMDDNVLLKIKPEGISSWMNTILASRLAKSAEEWARLFMTNSARTYSCQWMIVDYNRFKKGSPTQSKGLFWILEDVPTAFVSQDMTEHLLKHR